MPNSTIRFYSFSLNSVTAAQDLLTLSSASATFILLSARLTVENLAGDSNSDMLDCAIKRGSTHTAGSGGSTETEAERSTDAQATTLTATKGNTTQATGGDLDVLSNEAESNQVGYYHRPPYDEQLVFLPGESMIFALETAPAASSNLRVQVAVAEFLGVTTNPG